MKRWLFLTAALLLLTGCAAKPEPETTAAATEPTQLVTQPVTEPTGYYDPDSALEASTEGAVRVYPLNRSDSYGLVTMGEDLLLLSGTEVTTLTRLTGTTLYVSAAANLDCYIDAASPAFHASEKGVTYYDEHKNQLIFLDGNLKEGNRVSLPDGLTGHPALSADRKQLYYCTSNELRCIDLETGLDKLLKEMFFPVQSLVSLHCSDSILECGVVDEYGNAYGIFLSTQTGAMLWETLGNDVTLRTQGDSYFAIHYDGACRELLTGTSGEEPMVLSGAYKAAAEPVLELNAAVLIDASGEQTQLNYYDLETGTCAYLLQLPGSYYPQSIQSDAAENCVWFLRYAEDYTGDTLCRWELSKTATGEEASHLTPRRTYENPDTEALAACEDTAASIAKKHDVEILLWTSATEYQPESYSFTAEYQAPLIADCLEQLDAVLAQFPGGFLKKAAKGTADGRIKICLVREITGNVSQGQLEYSDGLQYWDANGNAYVAVVAGDAMAEDLYHELFHVIDSRVMSTCSAYDSWDRLNPDGFEYTYSYYLQPENAVSLLDGEDRAFIDFYSMSFPREDRARIMEYACTPGNEAYFESDVMQAKLDRLCAGIREAFGLEKSTELFLWEQYLQ